MPATLKRPLSKHLRLALRADKAAIGHLRNAVNQYPDRAHLEALRARLSEAYAELHRALLREETGDALPSDRLGNRNDWPRETA